MSRSYREQVEVRLGEPALAGVRLEQGWHRGALGGSVDQGAEVPVAFLWRGRLLVVRAVLAQWTQRVPWWRSVTEDRPATDLERQVWRVEAARGRAFTPGVYELSRAGCVWQLDRVCD